MDLTTKEVLVGIFFIVAGFIISQGKSIENIKFPKLLNAGYSRVLCKYQMSSSCKILPPFSRMFDGTLHAKSLQNNRQWKKLKT